MLVSTNEIVPTLGKKRRKEKRNRRGKTSFSGLSGSGLDFLEGAGRGRGGAGGGLRRRLVSIFLRIKMCVHSSIIFPNDQILYQIDFIGLTCLMRRRIGFWWPGTHFGWKQGKYNGRSPAYYLDQHWIPLRKILSSVCELVLCRYDVLFPSKLSHTETVISNHAQICSPHFQTGTAAFLTDLSPIIG